MKKVLRRNKSIIAALDIGGSKICCAIARLVETEKEQLLQVIGVGHHSSRGIRHGIITNIDELEDAILNAVHTAEQMAEQSIRDVYINITSRSLQSHTVDVTLALRDGVVEDRHIGQLLTRAEAQLTAHTDRQVLHVLPIAYTLDEQRGIRDPRGLVGQSLSVMVHVVSINKGVLQNLLHCVARCHLNVVGVVATPYASGLAALVQDERELGVTLVDIGGHHTTVAAFSDGSLIHLDTIAVGGGHITHDIAQGLSTSLVQAERLKTLYANVIASSADDRELVHFSPLGTNSHDVGFSTNISKNKLIRIARARTEEILEMVWERLERSGMDRLVGHRMVITGGGSLLPGVCELAQELWKRQVRMGVPTELTGTGDVLNTPIFSTCAGLLKFALNDTGGDRRMVHSLIGKNTNAVQRMVAWIRENF